MADPLHTVADEAKSVAYGIAKFLVVDDWKKLTDPKAPTWERTLAAVSLASNFVGPEGRALTAVAKPILMRAAESLAEHGAADAVKKLIERGGVAELGEAARYLRSHAAELGHGAKASLEQLEKAPEVAKMFEKARVLGHDIGEAGVFLENILTKSSLLPSLRELEGGLEKSPAILAAAAFAQRNTINTLLGNESLPSLPAIAGGVTQISRDLVAAGSELRDRGEGLFGEIERGGSRLLTETRDRIRTAIAPAEPQLHIFRNGRSETVEPGFHERGRVSQIGSMIGITTELDGQRATTMFSRDELLSAAPASQRQQIGELIRVGGEVDITLGHAGVSMHPVGLVRGQERDGLHRPTHERTSSPPLER